MTSSNKTLSATGTAPAGKHQNHDVGVIIAAGGAATRFGTGRNKLLCDLNGQPVVCHCLLAFLKLIPDQNLVVVVPPNQEAPFRAAFRAAALDESAIQCTAGGPRRQDSVLNGLARLPDSVSLVAVQDAARPWASEQLLQACIAAARKHGSGVAAHRVTDTIKIVDRNGWVRQTLPRQQLWASETPQVFQRCRLAAAYRKVTAENLTVTDDAQAMELAGFPVYLVENLQANTKITFAADLPGAAPATPWDC